MQYQLIVYDVWGNTRDGYEVNAAYTTANYIELNGDESDGLINRRLNALDVINAKGTTWEGEPGHILYGTNKRNGKPVCELLAVVPPMGLIPSAEGAEAEAQRVTWQGHIDDMRAAGWLVVAWTPQELRGVDTDYLEERVTSYGNELIVTTAEEENIAAQAVLREGATGEEWSLWDELARAAETQLDWVDNDSDDFTRGAHDL
jgi:hypothetical protein